MHTEILHVRRGNCVGPELPFQGRENEILAFLIVDADGNAAIATPMRFYSVMMLKCRKGPVVKWQPRAVLALRLSDPDAQFEDSSCAS